MEIKTIKLLIIEDDKDFIFFLKKCLSKKGLKYNIDITHSGSKGINQLLTEEYDCAIVDYSLPDFSGIEFIKAYKTKIKNEEMLTAFVMVTGLGNETVAVEALQLGYTDYLPKDIINDDNLWRVIESSIDKNNMKIELKEKQNALLKANNQMQQFVGIVSHDLQNPLGLIKSATDLLRMNSTKEQEECIEMISRSCKVSLDLISQLLDISALQSGKISLNKGPFNVKQLLDEISENFRSMIENKGVKLIIDSQDNHIVYADRNRIMQVLNNLVSNAIKFTPKEEKILCTTLQVDESIQVLVRDYGVGIDGKKTKDLFEKHIPTTAVGTDGEQGTGFGLPLAQEIMAAHGSSIEVDSQINNGSCFSFIIPMFK